MLKLGVVVVVINSDTVQAARLRGIDLWEKAQFDMTVSMVIMSPEQLVSKQCEKLVNDDAFLYRVFGLGVDEIHLLLTWGRLFHKPFRQIGYMRSRLLDSTVLIGLTATLRAGDAFESVCKFLGLHEGQFHLIRQSNLRHDIQIIY
jgi:superfamily II DNA helicase RecQ